MRKFIRSFLNDPYDSIEVSLWHFGRTMTVGERFQDSEAQKDTLESTSRSLRSDIKLMKTKK